MATTTLNRRNLVLSAVLILAPLASATAQETEQRQAKSSSLEVMTFNILHRFLSLRADRGWDKRRAAVAATIQRHRPDIVGLQEASRPQVSDLLEKLEGYAAFGRGSESDRWHLNTVLYRKDRFELVRQGELWLAEPGVSGRPAWGAWLPRIMSWGTLRHTGRDAELVVFNAHFSSTSAEARLQSARLLRDRLPKLAGGRPCMLLGDLNSTPRSQSYKTLVGSERAPLRDAYLEAGAPGEHGTIHSFSGKGRPGGRIDHVLVGGSLKGRKARIISDRVGQRYPSDHFPVLVELSWTRFPTKTARKLY